MRDVLKLSPDSPELKEAHENLKHSRCIQELAAEQWFDGSWGVFHSRSTRLIQKIPSTEVGVERARALGLDGSHPILQKVASYILNIMQGNIPFSDYPEKNDRWQTGVRLFLASTLSLIHPDHSVLEPDRWLWCEIATRTFQSGQYLEEDEINAHAMLTGATVKDSYLVIGNRYQLNILGSIQGTLSRELEMELLRWLWSRRQGIGYLEVPLYSPPPHKPGIVDRWLASLEMLARLFPSWVQFAQPSIDWIWAQRNTQGYWDFGPKPSSMAHLPLSDTWKERDNRQIDWTTRVLILLRQYYEHLATSTPTNNPIP